MKNKKYEKMIQGACWQTKETIFQDSKHVSDPSANGPTSSFWSPQLMASDSSYGIVIIYIVISET